VKVDINELRKQGKFKNFKEGPIPLGYLLEGEFASLYKNRFLPSDVDTGAFLEKSKPTKIIVMADGDVARNEVNPRTGQPQALGFDPFSGYTFANQDLLQNMVSYLIEDDGLITTRSKEVKIRLLDKEKVKRERSFWQGANIALPFVLLILFGFWRTLMRKRKYARF
jgi:gliding-associated putative ABC transporter substrate-binding component GldG